jgi:hypothetical protein
MNPTLALRVNELLDGFSVCTITEKLDESFLENPSRLWSPSKYLIR